MSIQGYQTLFGIILVLLIFNLITGVQPLIWIAVGIIGIVAMVPQLAQKAIVVPVTKATELIGTIISLIIIGLAYYIVLTPTALLFRLFNRNFLSIKGPQKGQNTLWKTRQHAVVPADFNVPW